MAKTEKGHGNGVSVMYENQGGHGSPAADAHSETYLCYRDIVPM